MKWKQLVTPVQSMNSDEAKSYVADRSEGLYTLLDVRQEKEYEQSRIPGATLIPLPELMDRMDELDPEKPVIVYCAVGGRSRAAAQILSGKGFNEVYNLKGGINAWHGRTAEGPSEFGMHLLSGDETVDQIIVLAYSMEDGMWVFYEKIRDSVEEPSTKELIAQLAGIEDKHKEKLFSLYKSITKSGENLDQFEAKTVSSIMESGMSTDEFIEQNQFAMQDIPGILNVAMALETQAFDLYLRYSQKATNKTTKDILYQIAQEEKSHLKSLGELMDDHF